MEPAARFVADRNQPHPQAVEVSQGGQILEQTAFVAQPPVEFRADGGFLLCVEYALAAIADVGQGVAGVGRDGEGETEQEKVEERSHTLSRTGRTPDGFRSTETFP